MAEKCHPSTVPCCPSFVNPQQQNHRNKLHWFKRDEAFQYTSNIKLPPRTASRVLQGSSTRWSVWNKLQIPVTALLMHLCADGLMHSEDWPPSSSWETECFISRETGCMCGFATCECTCSVKNENFTLKCYKHRKHCKHFKVKPQLPLSLSLGTCHPWSVDPEVVNEVL